MCTDLSGILVLLLGYFSPLHQSIVVLSRSSVFLTSISSHLSALRPSVRYSGMYIAELVSQKSLPRNGPVKPLDFAEIWEHQAGTEGLKSVDRLRKLNEAGPKDWDVADWEIGGDTLEGQVGEPDDDMLGPETVVSNPGRPAQDSNRTSAKRTHPKNTGKIQVISSTSADDNSSDGNDENLLASYNEYDSDSDGDNDDLQPYAMPNPPALSKSDLADLEDPSAYTPNKKKVLPPVYIHDLLSMLKQSTDAERLEVGLREAEGLIRRKAGWGAELGE